MGALTACLQRGRVDVLIATPGRLLDHLQTTPGMLGQLGFLVLDEADRLLDEGFQRDMVKIFDLLPVQRQTVLASATLPHSMAQFKHLCLRKDYVTVSAVVEGADAVNTQLHESVRVVTLDNWLPVLYSELAQTVARGQKTILFCQAAQETKLLALVLSCSTLFPGGARPGLFEIHSRLSQPQRVKVTLRCGAAVPAHARPATGRLPRCGGRIAAVQLRCGRARLGH